MRGSTVGEFSKQPRNIFLAFFLADCSGVFVENLLEASLSPMEHAGTEKASVNVRIEFPRVLGLLSLGRIQEFWPLERLAALPGEAAELSPSPS